MFYSDNVLENIKDDKLNREFFVNKLYDKVEEITFPDNFVIGLTGSWGSSKSSILNLLEKDLNDNPNYILINFNPWNFSKNEDELYYKFFNELIIELNKNNQDINDFLLIKKYLHKIKKSNISVFTGLIHPNLPECINTILKNLSGENDTLIDLKEKIDKYLESIDQKIIVIIDDIDRLDAIKVKEVFDLVKSLANFKNIIYILSFDKEFVIKSLNSISVNEPENFIRKILQLELDVPKISNIDLKSYIFNNLKEIIQFNNLYIDDETLNDLCSKFFIHYFKTIREVKNYSNYINFYLPLINNNILYLPDFLMISLLRIYEYNVYNLIRDNKDYVLDSIYYRTHNDINIEEKDKEKFLNKLNEKMIISNTNNVVKELFPGLVLNKAEYQYLENHYINKGIIKRRIISQDSFDLYFSFNKNDKLYDENEWIKINSLNTEILSKINKMNDLEFYRLLKSYTYYNTIIEEDLAIILLNHEIDDINNYSLWFDIMLELSRLINRSLEYFFDEEINEYIKDHDPEIDMDKVETYELLKRLINNSKNQASTTFLVWYLTRYDDLIEYEYFDEGFIDENERLELSKILSNKLVNYFNENNFDSPMLLFILEKWSFLTEKKEPHAMIKLNSEKALNLILAIHSKLNNKEFTKNKLISLFDEEQLFDIWIRLDDIHWGYSELYKKNKELIDYLLDKLW